MPLADAVRGSIPIFGAWALLAPAVARILERHPFDPAETGGETQVPLGEELDLCLADLEIERMRRPDEVRIEVDVPDEAAWASAGSPSGCATSTARPTA